MVAYLYGIVSNFRILLHINYTTSKLFANKKFHVNLGIDGNGRLAGAFYIV
jgi:hypothetical protein